jgi:probable F420-dependent oxidoreductase
MASTARTNRPLQVGIQLPEVERTVRWTELRDMARLAEEVGFDSLWVGDHLLYRGPEGEARGPWEAWSTLAALAAVTERVHIGPLVACTSFHNPAILAKKAATVHEISDGRLILGLGAGWNRVEYDAFGFPFDHRVGRFEEALAIIVGLLRDGAVTFEGRWHRVRDCVLSPPVLQPNPPPILVGTTGPRMLELTARHADAWNAWFTEYGNRPEGLGALCRRVDSACAAVGRDPATLTRTVAALVKLGEGEPTIRGSARDRVEPLRGSAPELAEGLRRFAAEGIAHVQLVVDPITVESIERLGAVLVELDG